MKKTNKNLAVITLLIMIVIVAVIFTGCEDNIPNMLSDRAYDMESQLAKLRVDMPDEDFWSSTDEVRILIEKTLEKRKPFSISFRLETDDGEQIFLDDLYLNRLTYMNEVWRSIVSGEAIYTLAQSKPMINAHSKGKKLVITGIIMKWEQTVGLDAESRVFSAVDLTNDGQWDYTTEGKIYFAKEPSTGLKDEFGKHLGIDQIEIRRSKLVEIKEDLTFDKLTKLALKG